MNGPAVYERVREALGQLNMDTALVELDDVLQRGTKEERSSVEVLDELLERELSARFERRVRTNFRLSGIPVLRRLAEFDFDASPEIPKRTIEEFHGNNKRLDFMRESVMWRKGVRKYSLEDSE